MTWTPDRIRALRRRLDLTQTELGERIATTPVQLPAPSYVTVGRWERGERVPDPVHAAALDMIAKSAGWAEA